MQSTFEKILKDGERKGYFRFHNNGAKIEYLPSGHKENPRLQTEDVENLFVSIPNEAKQEKIISGVQSSCSKIQTLCAQAAEVLANAQKQVEQMFLT